MVLSKQMSFANTTLSSKSRTSTGIPPSLSAFMRSFIAPKLKKSHWRNVRGPKATLPTFRSCADIFIALAFKSSSIARRLKSTSPANLRKQPTFRDATASFPRNNECRNSKLTTRHYPDLDSDASSVWNFCPHFSDVISQGGPVVASRNVGCFLRLFTCRIFPFCVDFRIFKFESTNARKSP